MLLVKKGILKLQSYYYRVEQMYWQLTVMEYMYMYNVQVYAYVVYMTLGQYAVITHTSTAMAFLNHETSLTTSLSLTSYKFGRKVTYINRLEELKPILFLERLDIPDEVKR